MKEKAQPDRKTSTSFKHHCQSGMMSKANIVKVQQYVIITDATNSSTDQLHGYQQQAAVSSTAYQLVDKAAASGSTK